MLDLELQLFHHICGVCIYGAHNVPTALVKFAIFCAKILILLIPLHIIYLSLTNLRKIKECKFPSLAIKLIIMLAIACLLSFIIGHFFYEPRPLITDPTLSLLPHRDSSSFPSNHAMVFSVYLYFLIFYRKNLEYSKILIPIAILFAILTCWARIFTAVHYPIDIFGGIIIGVISSFFVNKFFNSRVK